MEAEKNEALKVKKDVLATKEMIEEKLQLAKLRLLEKEKELEEVKQEVQHEKLRVGELEEATKKWEEDAIWLLNRYETLEGFINTVIEKAVVTLFFKDNQCYKLFSQVVPPIVGDAFAILRDHYREADLSFELPKNFKTLAAASEGHVYP